MDTQPDFKQAVIQPAAQRCWKHIFQQRLDNNHHQFIHFFWEIFGKKWPLSILRHFAHPAQGRWLEVS